MTSQLLLNSLLGIISPPDCCPRTLNNFYPACANYPLNTYDFIIVGGGTAGSVLANRLSKNLSIKVLLIEHGNYPSRQSEIPLDFILRQLTEEDWSFKASQGDFFKGTTNLENNWPQGDALGGSSTINAMIHAPGVAYDYDLWASITQDPDWSWSNMETMINKVDVTVQTTQYTSIIPGRHRLALGAQALGIPVNGPGMFGYKDHPMTIDNHTRNSMARAYLKPVMARPNLCVVVNTTVTKIIIDDVTDPGTNTAIGVNVLDLNTNTEITIKASREVIITAGAINSPKLLMLSGIGPETDLLNLGLPKVYSDLPVGQNLEDHVIVPVFAQITDIPMTDYNISTAVYCATGALLDNIELANYLGFFNTNDDTSHPNIEFIHFEFLANDPTFLEAFIDKFGINLELAKQLREANDGCSLLLFLPTLLHPLSRGYLKLKDLNPDTPPIIFSGYFIEENDYQVVVDAINQIIIRLLTTVAFVDADLLKFDIPECDNSGAMYLSYDYWKCYFSYLAGTIYHPAGTCRMGVDRTLSVVNSRLKVWDIEHLRVCDSSTIPALISGHTNIPTAALAENAAIMIITDNNI